MAIIDATAIMLLLVDVEVDWRGVEEGDLAGTEKAQIWRCVT